MEDELTIQEVGVAVEQIGQPSIPNLIGSGVQILVWVILATLQVKGNRQGKKNTATQINSASGRADELKKLINQNTEALERVNEMLVEDTAVSVATARATLKSIYNRLSPNRRLTVTEKAMITEMYQAYKNVTYPDGHHPNSWCDEIIKEIDTWEVVPDNYSPPRPTRRKTTTKATKE